MTVFPEVPLRTLAFAVVLLPVCYLDRLGLPQFLLQTLPASSGRVEFRNREVTAMDFVIGMSASLTVTVVFAIGGWRYGHRVLRKRYEGMVGDDYTGWGFVNDEAAELERRSQPQSQARIEYVARNILRIHVEHDKRHWTGEVSMENEHFGTIVWRYTDVAKGREAFGFKRIMVSAHPGPVKLLLVGEHPFGLEVFERDQ